MGTSWTRRLCAASLLVAAFAATPPSHADEPGKGDVSAARSLANAGFERFAAADYAGAFDRFQSAEELFHAPTHLLFMARSKVKLGELIDARNRYRTLVQETLPAEAPDAFREAQQEGRQELSALEARIPRLTIMVTGVGPSEARVTVDGAVVDPADTLYLAVGEHRVVAQAAGVPAASQTVNLAEGATESVTFALANPETATTAPVNEPDAPRGPPQLIPPAVVMGVGGVGLVVGAITGIVAMGKASDLDAACPDRAQCPADNESLEDSARTFGTVSTISFVAGGLCIAGGVAWLLFELSKDGGDRETAFVRPMIRGNEVGLGLSF